MPKVNFVKCARKDNPVAKKGESYYWWQFRFGGKRYSKEKPKQSQLTQSEFLGRMYELTERLNSFSLSETIDLETLYDERDNIVEEIRDLGQEQEDKRSNMPDHLQDTGSGEILSNRAEQCEEWASALENVDLDSNIDRDDYDNEEAYQEALHDEITEKISELCECEYEGE